MIQLHLLQLPSLFPPDAIEGSPNLSPPEPSVDSLLDWARASLETFGVEGWVMAAVAVALVLFGRRLYWLGVGGLGFLSALYLSQALPMPSEQARLVLGLVAGVAGIILAFTVQKLAIALAGFVLGTLAGFFAVPWIWPEAGPWLFAIALGTGLFGSLLARPFFDLALVVVSSAAGALLLAHVLDLPPLWEAIGVVVLVLFGVIVQTRKDEDDD